MSQKTYQLHCLGKLMSPHLCMFQDINKKTIIGRFTKRGGIYYVDVVHHGIALTSQGSCIVKQHQIWVWYRRFIMDSSTTLNYYSQHSSQSVIYLIYIFIFAFQINDVATYPLNTSKVTKSFALIHFVIFSSSRVSSSSCYCWVFFDDFYKTPNKKKTLLKKPTIFTSRPSSYPRPMLVVGCSHS